ncbi:MarR family winged helix-turn-helix transcriptional regulator [Pararhodobacter aggregans]|uniref:MarR family winged helix-turn-helix transcriptional regulator n=1 Tax=Pararhodobacter aggregans TaxID=404875 RepID=UPI003A8FBCD6
MFIVIMDSITMDRAALGSLVWQLSTRWRVEADRSLAPLGLTQAQYTLLAALSALRRKGGEPSQQALAQALGLSAIYVSKLLRALEGAGLVTRLPDPGDARARRLSLTPLGESRLNAARRTVAALDRQLTEPLGEAGGGTAQAFRIMLRSLLAHHDQIAGSTPSPAPPADPSP